MPTRSINRQTPGTRKKRASGSFGQDSTTQVANCRWYLEEATWRNNGKVRPPSPYHKRVVRSERHQGFSSRSYTDRADREEVTGYQGALITSERLSGDSSVASRAITEALLELKDQGINLPVAAAEASKTLDMVTDRLLRVASLARGVRRGRLPRWAKKVGIRMPQGRKKPDEIWLELQYGWMPLLSDIHGASQELAKDLSKPWFKKRGRASAEHNASGYVGTRPTGTKWEASMKTSRSVMIIATLNSAAKARAAALGVTNPAAVAWELVPFSFVVDWFLPIGDSLNALDATSGYTFVSGCITDIKNYTCKETIAYSQRVSNAVSSKNTEAFYQSFTMDRSVLTAFPSVPPPSAGSGIGSLKRALSALSLCTTSLRRLFS